MVKPSESNDSEGLTHLTFDNDTIGMKIVNKGSVEKEIYPLRFPF